MKNNNHIVIKIFQFNYGKYLFLQGLQITQYSLIHRVHSVTIINQNKLVKVLHKIIECFHCIV